MRRLRCLAGLILLAIAACETGPAPGEGVFSALVTSPHGAEGSAILSLVGSGLRDVTASDGWLWVEPGAADTLRVVVVADGVGDLRFRVAVADTLQRPEVVFHEVAGADDVLRESLAGYGLELVP